MNERKQTVRLRWVRYPVPDQAVMEALALAMLKRARPGYRLQRVSLTVAGVPPTAERLDDLMRRFFSVLRKTDRGAGVWAVQDVGKKGRRHWYGHVLTAGSVEDTRSAWRWVAPRSQVRVKLLDGQSDSASLDLNLRRSIAYMLKPLPRKASSQEVRVVVALGCVRRLVEQVAERSGRMCDACGDDLPALKRGGAKYCGSPCRKRAWRRRQKAQVAATRDTTKRGPGACS